jgi:ubiquitin-hydrolase Zn-finger-containing protein
VVRWRRTGSGVEDENRDRPLRLFRELVRTGRPAYRPEPCEHLVAAPARDVGAPDGCDDHVESDGPIVHLRSCLTCGHVGCCDSSQARHATVHAGSTGHPVIQSAEAAESWRWCYPHELLG